MFGGLISWFNDFYNLSILAVGSATEACFVPAGITSETITLYQYRQSRMSCLHAHSTLQELSSKSAGEISAPTTGFRSQKVSESIDL